MKTLFVTASKYLATLTMVSCLPLGIAHAAPHPGTATSTLVSPQLGLFRSPLGFQIASGQSGWNQTASTGEGKSIATMYKSAANEKNGGVAGSLTVRVDKLNKDMPLDTYVKHWMKEYPKYGFDVLGSAPFTQNKNRGYVLDLINRDNGRQIRQVVFLKKQRAVILTCRDQKTQFSDTLKGCNQIIRTFQWTE
jgi:hypothetical protein